MMAMAPPSPRRRTQLWIDRTRMFVTVLTWWSYWFLFFLDESHGFLSPRITSFQHHPQDVGRWQPESRGVGCAGRNGGRPVLRVSSLQATGSDSFVDHHESSEGLYRRFATVAWNKLLDTGWLVQEMANNNDTDKESTGLDSEETASDSSETRTFERLHVQQAPAKGMPPGSTVKIEIRALRPSRPDVPVQYARLALLETLVPSNSTATTTTTRRIQSQGIQVLNLVVFPSPDNHHPQPHPQQEQPSAAARVRTTAVTALVP